MSEAEADLYRGFCPNDRTFGVANGVDLDYFRPKSAGSNAWRDLDDSERTKLVFVGALDYQANIDGVTWFVGEVWPHLRRQLPDLTLGLVGRNPVAAVRALSAVDGVRVIGSVPDVRPYLAATDIAIAPLRIARGIQNKVLEAMAMAKPVVASRNALEGLACRVGHDVALGDSVSSWMSTICELMGSEDSRRKLATCGFGYAQAHHSWSKCLASFPLAASKQRFDGKEEESTRFAFQQPAATRRAG